MKTIQSQKELVGDILIVDDSIGDLKYLSEIVSKAGYNARPTISGKLALQSVVARLPDLILLDINMPEISGIEVCIQLKANSQTQHIPIIFLSAHSEIDLKVRALEQGGNDYITKPFTKAEVLARIKIHFDIYRLQQKILAKTVSLKNEIEHRKKAEAEQKQLQKNLQVALTKVLSGYIPICAGCKKIREEEGGDSIWMEVEQYVATHSEAIFSHGMCPDCLEKFYPGLEDHK